MNIKPSAAAVCRLQQRNIRPTGLLNGCVRFGETPLIEALDFVDTLNKRKEEIAQRENAQRVEKAKCVLNQDVGNGLNPIFFVKLLPMIIHQDIDEPNNSNRELYQKQLAAYKKLPFYKKLGAFKPKNPMMTDEISSFSFYPFFAKSDEPYLKLAFNLLVMLDILEERPNSDRFFPAKHYPEHRKFSVTDFGKQMIEVLTQEDTAV